MRRVPQLDVALASLDCVTGFDGIESLSLGDAACVLAARSFRVGKDGAGDTTTRMMSAPASAKAMAIAFPIPRLPAGEVEHGQLCEGPESEVESAGTQE